MTTTATSGWLTPRRRRLGGRVLTAVALAVLVATWAALNLRGIYFQDAVAYWRPDLDDLYGEGRVGVQSTYLYSPAFAQALWLPGLLPWPAFAAAFSALTIVALAWMVGPIAAAILLYLPFSPVADEISTGNIHLLLAAAIVIALRGGTAAWSIPLLTKVSPGVAILWHAGAREWRPLLLGSAVTAAVAAVSFVIAPAAWGDWIDTLRRSSSVAVPAEIGVIPGPLWLRTLAGGAVAVAGGWLGWRWTAPLAATLALPVPWSSGLSLLVGAWPLLKEDLRRRAADHEPAQSLSSSTWSPSR